MTFSDPSNQFVEPFGWYPQRDRDTRGIFDVLGANGTPIVKLNVVSNTMVNVAVRLSGETRVDDNDIKWIVNSFHTQELDDLITTLQYIQAKQKGEI